MATTDTSVLIKNLVQEQVKESHVQLVNKLDELMTAKLNCFNQQINENQRMLSEVQVAKIEQLSNDKYKFKKKGNEEQFKANAKVQQKLREADAFLKDDVQISRATTSAQEKIGEGMQLIEHRQKLIKMADNSDLGWKTVEEYEASTIADDSEDEKKMWKAETRAQRKMKQGKKPTYTNRQYPYSRPTQPNQSAAIRGGGGAANIVPPSRKPGVCFSRGKPGHWRMECRSLQMPEGQNKISYFAKPHCTTHKGNSVLPSSKTSSYTEGISPVGRLKKAAGKWESIGTNQVLLNIIKEGYMLPLYSLPASVELENNRSAREHKAFVESELLKLETKGCISQVKVKPEVVNPLTVSDKNSKLRLVLDCRHVNPHLYKYKFKYEEARTAKVTFKQGDYVFGFD